MFATHAVRLLFCVLALGVLTPAAAAQTNRCTRAAETRAEAEASTLGNWEAVYNSFQRYRDCDDGAIAEGYSEAITSLLAENWNGVGTLMRLMNAHRDFKDFVVKHIDQTVPEDRLKKIVFNAHSRCPSQARLFCKEIEAAAQ